MSKKWKKQMSKIQEMKLGMKVLKGRYVIARGVTPGMGSNDISIAQRSTDKKSDDVVWGATPGMGSNIIFIAQRSKAEKSNELKKDSGIKIQDWTVRRVSPAYRQAGFRAGVRGRMNEEKKQNTEIEIRNE